MTPNPDTEKHNDYLRSLAPVDPSSTPFTSIPPPPSPDAYCSLSLIRTGHLVTFPAWYILESEKRGSVRNLPCTCFLIEKKNKNGSVTRVLFELGLRDPTDHPHPVYKQYATITNPLVYSGVANTLEQNKIPVSSISAVILGHTHFDHTGDFATIPSASLVLGPGYNPTNAELADEINVPLSALEKNDVKILDRTGDPWSVVGSLNGFDYFGDGSLWLLDTPGHKPGHIAALVRTSASPPVYHVLGSDTCHAASLISPPSDPTGAPKAGLFPATELIVNHPDPHYMICMHEDLEEAYKSMAKVARMDQEENINVFLSHDASMDVLFPPKGSGGDKEFEFARLDGGIDELKKLKARDRSVVEPLVFSA